MAQSLEKSAPKPAAGYSTSSYPLCPNDEFPLIDINGHLECCVEALNRTLDVLAQRWHEEEQAMPDYLAGLSDDDLTDYVRYTTPEGEKRERLLWHCLLHVVNHGTQHRSEAAATLTRYGSSSRGLDFTAFLNEQQG